MVPENLSNDHPLQILCDINNTHRLAKILQCLVDNLANDLKKFETNIPFLAKREKRLISFLRNVNLDATQGSISNIPDYTCVHSVVYIVD